MTTLASTVASAVNAVSAAVVNAVAPVAPAVAPAQPLACGICTEPLHKRNRRQIVCFHCGHDASAPVQCSVCVETYLLASSQDPHCMHCRTVWKREFLLRVMPVVFHKKYDLHRRNVLEQRERCLFPATMPLVQLQQRVSDAEKMYAQCRAEIRLAQRRAADAVRALSQLNQQRTAMTANILAGRDALVGVTNETAATTGPVREYENFHRPCATEGCVGFISSRSGACTTCSKVTCLKCNVADIDKEEHTCKEEDKATWDALKAETKNCPGCQMRIFKISGCDQMWCPQCHTAFRWSTGAIERGPIHNPHYYEWLFSRPENARNGDDMGALARRRLGGRLGDAGCADPMPVVTELRHALTYRHPSGSPERAATSPGTQTLARLRTALMDFHRKLVEFRSYTLPRFQRQFPPNRLAEQRLELRVKLLTNQIAEDAYKRQLNLKEKKMEQMQEYFQIANTYILIQCDVLRRFVQQNARTYETAEAFVNDNDHGVKTLIRELNTNATMGNDSVQQLLKTFDSAAKSYKLPTIPMAN